MAKVKSNTDEEVKVVPPIDENKVQRNIDFNLKKEDLMLLILEGKKEVMEEVIAGLQKKKNQLFEVTVEKQAAFEKAVRATLMKALSSGAKKLIKTYSVSEKAEDESLTVKLDDYGQPVDFTAYTAAPINMEGRSGGTYIKTEFKKYTTIIMFNRVTFSITLNFSGIECLDKNKLFKNADPRPCVASTQTIRIGDETLDVEEQKKMKEYQELLSAVEDYNKCYSEMSEIMADYDLFSRNQTRAKASMIKEVLGRDDAGKALLDNISQAAKGVKLLG